MSADLLADVAAVEIGEGRYRCQLGPAWSFAKPSGGVLTSIALSAMERVVGDPAYRPLSATAIFASAIDEGELEVRIRALRRGRSAVQLRASLTGVGGDAGLEVSATFARSLSGPSLTGVERPSVPPPGEAEDLDQVHARWPFFHQLSTRFGHGARFWQPGFAAAGPRVARWFRYHVPPRRGERLDRLALPPLADTMPVAIASHLGGGAPRFYAPSLDLTIHFVADPVGEWILVDSLARRAWDGYASCQAELWDEDGGLVAYATQTMIMKEVK